MATDRKYFIVHIWIFEFNFISDSSRGNLISSSSVTSPPAATKVEEFTLTSVGELSIHVFLKSPSALKYDDQISG